MKKYRHITEYVPALSIGSDTLFLILYIKISLPLVYKLGDGDRRQNTDDGNDSYQFQKREALHIVPNFP
jgi:hypothetical protein